MLRLRLLGGLALEAPDGRALGRATQKRRLALLSLLAVADGRRLRRDKIVALLWPECREDEARQRLSTALYDIKQGAGVALLGANVEEVWLDAAALAIDLDEFHAAHHRGDHDTVVRAYAGPFLDGVHVEGAPEFEEWASQIRRRVELQFEHSLREAARRHDRVGTRHEAVALWRRLFARTPHDDTAAMGLIQSLSAAGERSAAIAVAAEYQRSVRSELGAEPDPAVASLVEAIRTHPPARPASDVPPVVADGPSVDPRARPRGRRRVALGMAGLLTAACAGLAAIWIASPGGRDAPTLPRLVVFPFAVHGGVDATIAEGVAHLLARSLDGSGVAVGLTSPLPGAAEPTSLTAAVALRESRRLRGDRFVLGTASAATAGIRLQLTVYDAAGGRRVGEASVDGAPGAVATLVDSLTARVIALQFGRPQERLTSVAALTSGSIPALRAYLRGETAFRRGDYLGATEGFGEAVQRDSTFALAWYRLALASLWGNVPGTSTDHADAMMQRYAMRLAPRERTLVDAYLAWRIGDADQAERLYRQLLVTHDDDAEAWHQLGETQFHYNPLRGRPVREARSAFARVLALDPRHRGAQWHLALVAALEGKRGEFLARSDSLIVQDGHRASLDGVALVRRLASESGGAGAIDPRIGETDEVALSTAAWRLVVYLRDFRGAQRAYETMQAEGRSSWSRLLGGIALADLALVGGQWNRARAMIAALEPSMAYKGLLGLTFGAVQGELRVTADERRALRREIAVAARELMAEYGAAATPRLELQYCLALLDVSLGDTANARRAGAELQGYRGESPDSVMIRSWGRVVLAALALQDGQAGAALTHLEFARMPVWYGLAVSSTLRSQSYPRYLRAQALEALGREREALGWYRGFSEHAPHDLTFAGAAMLRRALIHERLGEPREAAALFAQVAALWSAADSNLVAQVRLARERSSGVPVADSVITLVPTGRVRR